MRPLAPPFMLRSASLSCDLSPDRGGSIVGLRLRDEHGTAILRPSGPLDASSFAPLALACFPMLPFTGRIAEGRFSARRDGVVRNVTLPATHGFEPHAIHGHAWTSAFGVVERGDREALFELRHDRGAWPWSYVARQRFVLDDRALRVTLEVENCDRDAMPAGMGLHPYFPRDAGTRVRADVRQRWLNDAAMIPSQLVAVPAEWRLADGAAVDALELDHCFEGWSGTAVIDQPSSGVRVTLRADAIFGRLVIYSPPAEPYFCVEPVTHVASALNVPDEDRGVVWLGAGERLCGTVRFEVG